MIFEKGFGTGEGVAPFSLACLIVVIRSNRFHGVFVGNGGSKGFGLRVA